MKKNNRTNNPALLVSTQFADSKPENKTKKIKNKIYSIIYTEFLFFFLCWVVKKEKNCFTIRKLSINTVKEFETEPNPQNTLGGNPKKKKSPAHYSMSRPQVDVATWNSLDGSLSIATSSFQVATFLSFNSLD